MEVGHSDNGIVDGEDIGPTAGSCLSALPPDAWASVPAPLVEPEATHQQHWLSVTRR